MPHPPALTPTAEALLAPRLEQRVLPGLERIEHALAALGSPARACPSGLIVGTNGKGSTAALLAGILEAHGVRTGLHTSPHLVRVEERIRVAGEAIAAADLKDLVADLARFTELSYFETLTAAALEHFARRGVELAVLEAGLGARWDATNVGEPALTLLTNLGTDHQSWLGPTRAHVGREKAAALGGRAATVGAWDDEVEPEILANQSDYDLVEIGQAEGTLGMEYYPPKAGAEKAANVARHQDWRTLFNSLVKCLFANVDPETVLALVNASSGLSLDLDAMMNIGERGWNLKRVINHRLGLTRQNDRLPKALLRPYNDDPDGKQGFAPDLEPMLRAYYLARGWDPVTGFPGQDKSEELGLGWTLPDLQSLL